VIPTNRRVKKPQLPPSVAESAGIDGFEPLEDSPRESLPSTHEFAPKRDASADKSAGPSARASAFTIARGILGVALVIAVSGSVAWGARKHVMSSTRFVVKEIDVTGTHRRTNDDVVKTAGLELNKNVFLTDLDDARAKLVADPWISDATLARRLPGTILVQVTEREAGALVALGETYLATPSGNVFKKLELGDPVDLPIVTGLTLDYVTDDREGAARTIRRAIDLANDYDRGPLAGRAALQEVHVAADGAMTLVVGKPSVSLMLGEPPYRKKIEQAARVVAELDKRGAKADAIMLDNEARPERVVVRMR
jgi:cell division protein FtsQ